MADQDRNYLDQISHASSWLSQIFRALAICFASVYTHFGGGRPPKKNVQFYICSLKVLISSSRIRKASFEAILYQKFSKII